MIRGRIYLEKISNTVQTLNCENFYHNKVENIFIYTLSDYRSFIILSFLLFTFNLKIKKKYILLKENNKNKGWGV